MQTFNTQETKFLNVDLDILSEVPLGPLLAAFGRKVEVLYVGKERSRYGAHLELAGTVSNADKIIAALAELVGQLPRPARRLWNDARVKNFNIGIQGGFTPRHIELSLNPKTLRAVTRLGASIVITVYSAEKKSNRAVRSSTRNRRSRIGRRRAQSSS